MRKKLFIKKDCPLFSGLFHSKIITFINNKSLLGYKLEKTIIIATVYSYEPVISSVTQLGAKKLIMLIDKEPDDKQKNAIKEIKNNLEKYVDLEFVKTDVYDIVKIASDCIKIIDGIGPEKKIMLNVSAGRKTKAFGLVLAGYARFSRIKQIFYVTKESKEIVILPKLCFNLNKSQNKILNFFNTNDTRGIIKVYHELNMSKSMYYKTHGQLVSMGLIFENKITDAGKIALL